MEVYAFIYPNLRGLRSMWSSGIWIIDSSLNSAWEETSLENSDYAAVPTATGVEEQIHTDLAVGWCCHYILIDCSITPQETIVARDMSSSQRFMHPHVTQRITTRNKYQLLWKEINIQECCIKEKHLNIKSTCTHIHRYTCTYI